MKEAVVKENDEKNTAKHLAESSPTQDPIDTDHLETAEESQVELSEESIIGSIRLLLREYGIRKSGAAIRDAVDIPNQKIGPKEAVSALSNFGFRASFGSIKLKI